MRSPTNNMNDIVINHTGKPAQPRMTEEQRELGKVKRILEEREFERELEAQLKEVWE